MNRVHRDQQAGASVFTVPRVIRVTLSISDWPTDINQPSENCYTKETTNRLGIGISVLEVKH